MAPRLAYIRVERETEMLVGVTENHSIKRERTFDASASLDAICHVLRLERATGKLVVDMNCGGKGTIRFCEEQVIDPT
jgi:hypothetical protein